MNNQNNNNFQVNESNSSMSALKIIFILSISLVLMDVVEAYFTFTSLVESSKKLSAETFQACIKYQSFAEIFFAFFGSLAGISVTILTLGIIINLQYFFDKILDTFFYFNYCVFGPYLLTSTLLGFYYYDNIAYVCDSHDIKTKYLNVTIIFCLFFAFFMSMFITLGTSAVNITNTVIKSVRFEEGGNYLIGKLFWRFIRRRINSQNRINNQPVEQPLSVENLPELDDI